jgi:hypothetical protein
MMTKPHKAKKKLLQKSLQLWLSELSLHVQFSCFSLQNNHSLTTLALFFPQCMGTQNDFTHF